jgi:hypothetical protein
MEVELPALYGKKKNKKEKKNESKKKLILLFWFGKLSMACGPQLQNASDAIVNAGGSIPVTETAGTNIQYYVFF